MTLPARLQLPWLTLAAALSAGACDRPSPPPPAPPVPQSSCLAVTSEAAPLFRKPSKDGSPHELLHAGELVKLVSEQPALRWAGLMDGVAAQRDGVLLEVKSIDDGSLRFGFRADFGAEVSVPATSWLCDQLSSQPAFHLPRCAAELRRARTVDGAIAVYMPCSSGPCPVGVLRDGKVSVLGVESLTAARFFLGKKRSMLLASVRWSKDEGKQSGGAYLPILLDGPAPVRQPEISTDRIDARDPTRVTQRLVQARVTPTEIALTGEETTRSEGGALLSTTPIDEKHPLPALD